MRAVAFGLAVAVCGCGEAPVDGNGSATANQIERLSAPREEEGDLQVSARPMPLSVADVEREGLSGPGCSFTGGGTRRASSDIVRSANPVTKIISTSGSSSRMRLPASTPSMPGGISAAISGGSPNFITYFPAFVGVNSKSEPVPAHAHSWDISCEMGTGSSNTRPAAGSKFAVTVNPPSASSISPIRPVLDVCQIEMFPRWRSGASWARMA